MDNHRERSMLLLLSVMCWLSIDLTMSRSLTADDWGRLAGSNDPAGTDIRCVESSSCRGRVFGSRSEDVAEFGNIPPCQFHGWIRCIEQTSDDPAARKYYSYQQHQQSSQPETSDYRSSSISIPQSHYGYVQYQPRKVTEPPRFLPSIQHWSTDPSRLVKQDHLQEFIHQSFQQTQRPGHQQSTEHVRNNHFKPTAIQQRPAQHSWHQPAQQAPFRFSSEQSQQFRQLTEPAQPNVQTFQPAQQSRPSQTVQLNSQQSSNRIEPPIGIVSQPFNQQPIESRQRPGNGHFHSPVQPNFQSSPKMIDQQQIMDSSHRFNQLSQQPSPLAQLGPEEPRISQVTRSEFQQQPRQSTAIQMVEPPVQSVVKQLTERLVQTTEKSPFDTTQRSIETNQKRPAEPRRLKEPDAVQHQSIGPVEFVEPAKSSLERIFQFESIDTQQQLAALIRSLALSASQPAEQLTANSDRFLTPSESNVIPFIPFSDPLPLEMISNNFRT